MSIDLSLAPIFDVCNLRCGYQSGMPLISIPRMQIVSGQVVGICGANGSGKSTLMKALLGLTPCAEGSVHINGHELPRVRPETIAKHLRVGYLPQHSRAFANLSVWENISIACQGADKRRQVEDLLARPEYEALRDIATAPARSLSGGEALMLGLACLEAFDPEILFLDEPTAGADQALRDFCVKLIFRWSKEGRGVVLVEQDHAALLAVAESCYALVASVPVSNDYAPWQPPNTVLPIPNEQYARIKSGRAPDKLMDIVNQMNEIGEIMNQEPTNPPVILEQNALKPNNRLEVFHALVLPIMVTVLLEVCAYVCFMLSPNFHIEFNLSREISVVLTTCLINYMIYAHKLNISFRSLSQQANEFHHSIQEVYSRGFPLIRTGIIHEMKKRAMTSSGIHLDEQKQYDNHIFPPLKYCHHLVSGNRPPEFEPEAEYINLLFKRPHVIAITGAPVEMWMDPALGYFLVNSLLASLIGNFNQQLQAIYSTRNGKSKRCCKLETLDREQHKDDYEKIRIGLLEKLTKTTDLLEGERFVARFFIIDNDDYKANGTLLESLYALHELFGVQAYFIRKEALEQYLITNRLNDDYAKKNEAVWKAIYNNYPSEKNDTSLKPEFLVFHNKKDGADNAEVYTYRKGKALRGTSADSLKLIEILAGICLAMYNEPEFWFNPTTSNQYNCFVHVTS